MKALPKPILVVAVASFAICFVMYHLTFMESGTIVKQTPLSSHHAGHYTESPSWLWRPLPEERKTSPVGQYILNAKYKPLSFNSFTGNTSYASSEDEFAEKNSCEPFLVQANISVTKAETLRLSFAQIEKAVLKTKYKDIIKYPDEDNNPAERLKKHWHYFSGASVWLQDYGVHYYTTRVIFSPNGGGKHDGSISFVYNQVFDASWREITDGELELPEHIWKDVPGARKTLNFPSVVPVPIVYDKGKMYMGPEDPRILTRRNPSGFDEPMIVFNMMVWGEDTKRGMHAYFPFTDTLVKFVVTGFDRLEKEKNWTPFFNPQEPHDATVEFIYNVNPLEILRCDLVHGWCHFIHGMGKLDEMSVSDISSLKEIPVSKMRGGTTLWPLPAVLQTKLPANKRLWVGFARAHLQNCGCGGDTYRPNFLVMQHNTVTGEYEILINGEFSNLNMAVSPWNPGSEDLCSGISVLIPNGISYWHVQESKDGYNDYMGLTLSSADENVQILHIRGLLDHIASIPGLFDKAEGKIEERAEKPAPKYSNGVSCALEYSRKVCKEYGKHQKEIKDAKEKL